MGLSIIDLNLYSYWELLVIAITISFLLIGLYFVLRKEFSVRATINLVSLFSIISVSSLWNELRIREFLTTSDAEVLVREADQLWNYMKYRESYEKLENAINVAGYQNDNKNLIAGYGRITDRYFIQPNYQTAIDFTDLEREVVGKALKFIDKYEEGEHLTRDPINSQSGQEATKLYNTCDHDKVSFYNYLHQLNMNRNDPFENNLYYSSYARKGNISKDSEVARMAYMRAVNIIALAMEVENDTIPHSWLGKYYHAISTLEENLNNYDQAYEYIQKSVYYWNDYRPRIQAVRLALNLGYYDEAHFFIEEIVAANNASGRLKSIEIYILEAANLELSVDHLDHALQLYNNLQSLLAIDLKKFDSQLENLDRDYLTEGNKTTALNYPFLNDVRNLRTRIGNIDNRLGKIRSRYFGKAKESEKESRIAEIGGSLEISLDYLYEAIDHARNAKSQFHLYKYHLHAANILNRLTRHHEALEHISMARAVHNGDNFVLIRKKTENDIAKHYPELLLSQLGLGHLEDAKETLEILHDLGRTRVYENGPNAEMYEYLKGKILYHVKTGELIRAELYHEDAVNYLLRNAEAMNIPLSLNIDSDLTSVNNPFQTYMNELIILRGRLFKSKPVLDFL